MIYDISPEQRFPLKQRKCLALFNELSYKNQLNTQHVNVNLHLKFKTKHFQHVSTPYDSLHRKKIPNVPRNIAEIRVRKFGSTGAIFKRCQLPLFVSVFTDTGSSR